MRLPRLRRPRLSDRDPAARRAAVARLDARGDAREALGRLLAEDPDPGVRAAAVKRLEDLAQLRACAEQDADALVRESARARYRQLLAGGGAQPLAEREAELARCGDLQLLAHVARSGREEALRAAALARIADAAVLEEAARHDPRARLRRQAARQLADAAALQRLACAGRDVDRRVVRIARERLAALEAAGEAARGADAEAYRIIRELEALADRQLPGAEAARARLINRWRQLVPPPGPRRQQAFDAALAAFDAAAASADRVNP